MSYRPQYVYPPTPVGFEDEEFHYSFDSTTTPLLATAITTLAQVNDIILPLQADAPFIARGLRITLGTADSTLDFKLKTPAGDYMETTFVPIARYAAGGGLAIAGRLVVPFDTEIECPAGSNWTLYLYNPTGGNVNPPAVTLFGVKRRQCNAGIRRAA